MTAAIAYLAATGGAFVAHLDAHGSALSQHQ
jgi:hypothetical protein